MGLGLGIRRKLTGLLADTPAVQELMSKFRPRDQVFGKAYSTRVWGSDESHSGSGSELGATETLRSYLPQLFERLGTKTFVDAPCGDWNWMRKVDLSKVTYIGIDIVPGVIARNTKLYQKSNVKFILADLTKDELPKSDLILCRDCLVHLSFKDISDILANFRRSGARYLLASNSPHVQNNTNKITGLGWRHINLMKAPFDFPPPLESFKDHYSDVPFFTSLWRIEDLPDVRIQR